MFCFPSEEDYLELSHRYNLIPVSCQFSADVETPITVFLKVAAGHPSFLLESVEGGEKVARYSFIGLDPILTYSHQGNTGWLSSDTKNISSLFASSLYGLNEKVEGNPFNILERLVACFKAPELNYLPRFFGGAVGYFGYDLVRWLEKLPSSANNDLEVCDCQFIFNGTLLIFDHVRQTLQIVVNSIPGQSPRQDYHAAAGRIEEILRALNKPVNQNISPNTVYVDSGFMSSVEANVGRDEFMKKVERAKEYIKKGDILQVVLSQRFRVPFSGNPFQAYRRLRSINPSPYLFLLDFGDTVIAGSSPEMLVRVVGREVETRPIAGTRPRGKTPKDDQDLARELLVDPKERAEHIMLVDLGRNDLGRVCMPGSVSVPQFMIIEKYSHVMHLVSSVKGTLAPGYTAFDAFKACFPAGTVSGAPKIRAMEIIEELEDTCRGPYAGAVGYLGFNNNLDTAITIRTIVFHRGYAYVQAGAGIVADSDPEREYQETLNKAWALLQTLAECTDSGGFGNGTNDR